MSWNFDDIETVPFTGIDNSKFWLNSNGRMLDFTLVEKPKKIFHDYFHYYWIAIDNGDPVWKCLLPHVLSTTIKNQIHYAEEQVKQKIRNAMGVRNAL
jgi:oligoribonuclease (3'-5' exoribonuclease)